MHTPAQQQQQQQQGVGVATSSYGAENGASLVLPFPLESIINGTSDGLLSDMVCISHGTYHISHSVSHHKIIEN
jgi:hypothetical protein